VQVGGWAIELLNRFQPMMAVAAAEALQSCQAPVGDYHVNDGRLSAVFARCSVCRFR
jgi:hypothetical protein